MDYDGGLIAPLLVVPVIVVALAVLLTLPLILAAAGLGFTKLVGATIDSLRARSRKRASPPTTSEETTRG